MNFRLSSAITVGKGISFISRVLGLGAGGTWPGHAALKIYPSLVSTLESQLPRGSILITGTNGKTTTAKLVSSALEASGCPVLRNPSGANLLNGVASSLLLDSNIIGRLRSEIGVFEIDEAEFPNVLGQIQPEAVVVLNLFRDQLDRYAELDFVASKWRRALEKLPSSTKIILNADDPLVASLGEGLVKPVFYFGLEIPRLLNKEPQTVVDSLHCSRCGNLLSYRGFYYSHVGVWRCSKCRRKRPKLDVWCSEFDESGGSSEISLGLREPSDCHSIVAAGHAPLQNWATHGSRLRGRYEPAGSQSLRAVGKVAKVTLRVPLVGLFNIYNILAAALVSQLFGIDITELPQIWENFDPAFGRQEEFVVNRRRVKILLSKNPTGFTENLRLIVSQKSPKNKSTGQAPVKSQKFRNSKVALLLVLNDGIADGRDVSWIWDVDFEVLKDFKGNIWVSGRRKEDLALRLKYEGIMNYELGIMDLREALAGALESIPEGGILYILPTYTAMLEVRKILKGRKIL